MSATPSRPPKLRPIDAQPVVRDGHRSVLLRDPLQLSEKNLFIPPQLSPALAMLDGSRELSAIRAALAVRFGLRVAMASLEQLVSALDDAFLLENSRFLGAQRRALAEYREAPHRPLASAGSSYPREPDHLRRMLRNYWEAAGDVDPAAEARGMICPHIDYARGGRVYAQVWKPMEEMARAAEIVVLLGTDHYCEGHLLTLTKQSYATPLGVLPTAGQAVEAIAQAMGPERSFAGELHHRAEHSIELAAVWLQYARHEQPCDIIPVLCGSFEPFVRGEAEPEQDPMVEAFLSACRQSIAGRRALVVAAADLAHVGPAFGGPPLGLVERARLQSADDALIERIRAGDASGFLAEIRSVEDRNNVCGVPPIYLALRLLDPVRGAPVAHLRCPADAAETSWVTICGVVLQ